MRGLLVTLLAGIFVCTATAAPRKPISSFSKLGKNEAVVVGRVELVPPLLENEQRIRGPGTNKFKNKIFLMVDAQFRELTEEPGFGDFKGRIDAVFGEEFFVRSSNEPFYLIAAMMYLTLEGMNYDQAYFPGGFKVSINPDDKAVYIGTLRYHRNEFFELTNIEIVDDYQRVNAEFKARFGDKHALRKALMERVN